MDVVVGLNKEYLSTVEEIVENVLELIFLALSEQHYNQAWELSSDPLISDVF